MTYSIQVTKDNGIINLNAINNIYQRRTLRVVLFLLSPIIPVTIMVKSALLSTRMKQIIANWKREDSASVTWLEMEKMKAEKAKVSESFSMLKMMEINLEAVIQLLVLVTFNLVPRIIPKSHGLGSEFNIDHQSWTSWLFLIGSTSITAFSVIYSTLYATSLSKGKQIGTKATMTLGASFSFQLASHLFKNVTLILASLGRNPALKPTKAGLLLIVPGLAHWVLLFLFMPARVTKVQEKLAHLVLGVFDTIFHVYIVIFKFSKKLTV